MASHGNQLWSLPQCKYKMMIILEQIGPSSLPWQLDLDCARNALIQNRAFFCDGSWSSATNSGGFAAVHLGPRLVHHCKAGFADQCYSPIEAELLGIILGMELADMIGVKDAVFCSDSTQALWSLFSGSCLGGCSAEIVFRGEVLLNRNPGWRIAHVMRDDNTMADMAARKARIDRWSWARSDALPRLNWLLSENHYSN